MGKRIWKPKALAALGFALVCLISAAIWTLLRSHGISDFAPTFLGACERIRMSGVPPNPGDWWCSAPSWHEHANFMWSALTIWISLAFPSAILAATGRRATALVPMLAAPLTLYLVGERAFFWVGGSSPQLGITMLDVYNSDPFLSFALLLLAAIVIGLIALRLSLSKLVRRSIVVLMVTVFALVVFAVVNGLSALDLTITLAVNLILLAAPAAAIALVLGRREVRLPEASPRHQIVAAGACAAGAAVVVFLAARMFAEHGREFGGLDPFGSATMLAGPAVTIGLFGALLGNNRRYWPWSLVVAALFLSQAPSLLPIYRTYPDASTNWVMFGAVIPLAAVGLLGSAWQPLTVRLAHRRTPARTDRTPPAPRSFRPVVLLNSAAVGILVVSFMMYRGDPLPAQINTPLPTYLGTRTRAEDARTMMNLRDAIAAAERYSARHHTYAGFDAASAASLEPSLAWQDGVESHRPSASPGQILDPLVVGIVSASDRRIRIATRSNGGYVACIQATSGGVTYGKSPLGSDYTEAMRAAVSACGSTPWTEDAIRPPPEMHCTEEEGNYLMCRMVEVLVHNTMKTAKPEA